MLMHRVIMTVIMFPILHAALGCYRVGVHYNANFMEEVFAQCAVTAAWCIV
jgi:hypothetical protein